MGINICQQDECQKRKKKKRKGEGMGGNERDATIILFISIVKHGY